MSSKKRSKAHMLIRMLAFLAYILLLTYFLIFAELMGRGNKPDNYAYNLVLFKEIGRFIEYRHILGMRTVLLNLVGNVVGFMPLGFILPLVSRKAKNGFVAILYVFSFSLILELIQLVAKVGSFDVDDLLLNTVGGILGYIVYYIGSSMVRRKEIV